MELLRTLLQTIQKQMDDDEIALLIAGKQYTSVYLLKMISTKTNSIHDLEKTQNKK